jgi:hypothetical protein
MSLLTIVQNAAVIIAIPKPSTVIGNTNAQVMTLLGLAQNGGRILARSHNWQALTKRVTATGVAANAQTGQPPTAYDRFAAVQRIWDDTRNTWLIGPMSTDDWDGILVQPQTAYPTYWTLLNGVVNIAPAPTTSDSFVYTYISKNWIRPDGGTGSTDAATWAADSDNSLLDESLHELDLIWRYKQAKGLDYAEDMATFEREKEKGISRDRGPKSVKTTTMWRGDPPGSWWPGTITQV